jgi:predicted MFS family arabinose efflux permease
MGVVVMPVIVPFLAARGVTGSDVLSLQAIYGVAVMLFEVPTGTICDIIGCRRTMLIGAALNLLGWTAFAFAGGFAAYAGVEVLLAAAWSLVSGADITLIYQVLDGRDGDRDQRRRALSNYVLAQVLGEAVAALLGGVLAAWSLDLVGWVTAAEAVLPLLIAAMLPGGGGRPGAVSPADFFTVWRDVFGDRSRRLLFANMVVWSLATFIAVWLLQPYWTAQGVGLRWFGVLWAGTLVTVGVVSRAAPVLTRLIGQRGVLLVLAALPVIAYAGMAWLGGGPGVACGFFFYVSRGLSSVNLREAFNHRISARWRATSNSLTSGAFRLSFAICGPLVGLAMDRAGLDGALALLAGAFLLAFVLLVVPLMLLRL